MSSARQDSAPPSAWQLLALLTLLNVFNFIDRQLITSLQIPLGEDPDLHLTVLQNQLLAGYSFSIVYSIAGLVLGMMADRTHRPRLIALGLLIWSGATAASGLAHNFSELALARIFVAFGEATLTPAAIAMLADVFRSRQRSLASGLYYLGVPIGSSFSFIIPNLLWPIPWIGWRGCFFGLGLIGLSMVLVLMFIKDPQRGATESLAFQGAQTERRSFLSSLLETLEAIRRTPALWMTMLGAVIINIGVGATWLDTKWLFEERGFTKSGAPIFIGCMLLVGGSVGNILGGWMGDMFNKRRSGGRLLAIVVSQIAIAPFVIAYRFLPGDYFLLLGVCYGMGSILITIMYGPVLATIQELSPVRFRSTTVALLMIGLNIFGASLGSVLAAWLAGFLHSFTWGIFITAQASLLSSPFFLLAYRRYETDLARLSNLQLGEQKV